MKCWTFRKLLAESGIKAFYSCMNGVPSLVGECPLIGSWKQPLPRQMAARFLPPEPSRMAPRIPVERNLTNNWCKCELGFFVRGDPVKK